MGLPVNAAVAENKIYATCQADKNGIHAGMQGRKGGALAPAEKL